MVGDCLFEIVVRSSRSEDHLSDLDFNSTISMHIGGAAGGVAMMLAQMGATPELLSVIGSDEYAKKIIQEYRALSIGTSFLLPVLERTPVCVSILGESERSIFIDQRSLPVKLPTNEIERWMRRHTSCVYATAVPWARSAVIAASNADHRVVVDLQTCAEDGDLDEFRDSASIILHSGALIGEERGLLLSRELSSQYANDVILSVGARGNWLVTKAGKEASWYPQLDTVSIPDGHAIGAGDAFAAGFVQAYAERKSLAACVISGQSTAARMLRIGYYRVDKHFQAKEGRWARR